MSPAALARLKRTLEAAEARDGKLTIKGIFGNAPPPPLRKPLTDRNSRPMSDAANEHRKEGNRCRESEAGNSDLTI